MKYRGLIYALIARRLAMGLTQAELAERMQTNSQHVSRLETMHYAPRLHTLETWGTALGVHIDFNIRVKKRIGRKPKND